jgi:hypothetical protein
VGRIRSANSQKFADFSISLHFAYSLKRIAAPVVLAQHK